MSRLDVRTRTAADIRQIDVPDFFGSELPHLIRERWDIAAPGAALFDPGPMAVTTASGRWVLALDDGTVRVLSDGHPSTVIRTDDDALRDYLNDLTTFQMLKNLERLELASGSLDDMAGWDTILRSLVDGRPIYTPGAITLRDLDGAPLDVGRTFTPDDDDAEIANFLAETGYLHLSGWLDIEPMNEIAAEIERGLAEATPGDGSWWATLRDGSRQPVRLVSFERRSPAVAKLTSGAAFRRLSELTSDGYVPTGSVEALNKPLGVVSGTSDIGWHHDCALGMHSYKCCSLVIGISVTDGGPGSGQLSVLPGSHRALMPKHRLHERYEHSPITASTRAGDLTVHCSCLLHRALVPTETERKVMYTSLNLPERDAEVSDAYDRVWQQRTSVTSAKR